MGHPRTRLRTLRRREARDLVRRYNYSHTGPKLKLRDVWPLFITLCDANGNFYTPKNKKAMERLK